MKATKEKIGGDRHWFVCLCGNEPDQDGFDTCLPDGTPVEPDVGGGWVSHYVCEPCGRVIDGETLEVVGRWGQLL